MYRERLNKRILYLCIDIIVMHMAFYLSYFFRGALKTVASHNIGVGFGTYAYVFALWGIILIFNMQNLGLHVTDLSLSIPQETWKVFKAVAYSSLLLSLIIFWLKVDFFSRIVFIAAVILLWGALSLWRIVKRIIIRRMIAKGKNCRNILIVGAGRVGMELAEEIEDAPYSGIKIVGFLDDYKSEEFRSYKIVGKIKDLEKIICNKFVDEVFVTIPSYKDLVSKVISKVRSLGRSVSIVADNFHLPVSKLKVNYVGFIPLISYHEKTLHGTDSLVKRVIDVIISSMLLISALPVFLIIYLAIKIDSRGYVLYISKRSGRKGKVFNFYKFRTMYNNADNHKESLRSRSEVSGPVFKMRNDPRITRVGRFLRRYSLDELPQLINVLKGDMSLVGPRPLPVEESRQCEGWQLPRLEVRPGLACIAQVRGRSDLSFYKWMKWDLWYIDNWSLRLDFQILFWMIPAVIKRKGAY